MSTSTFIRLQLQSRSEIARELTRIHLSTLERLDAAGIRTMAALRATPDVEIPLDTTDIATVRRELADYDRMKGIRNG